MSLVNKIVQFNQRNNRGSLIKTRFIETTTFTIFLEFIISSLLIDRFFATLLFIIPFCSIIIIIFLSSSRKKSIASLKKFQSNSLYENKIYLVHLFRPISAARFIKLFSPEKFFKYFFSSQSITVHDLHDACTSRNE